jgi:hypothetical protein
LRELTSDISGISDNIVTSVDWDVEDPEADGYIANKPDVITQEEMEDLLEEYGLLNNGESGQEQQTLSFATTE